MTVRELKAKLEVIDDKAEILIHTFGGVTAPKIGYQMDDTGPIVYIWQATRNVPLNRPFLVRNDIHESK